LSTTKTREFLAALRSKQARNVALDAELNDRLFCALNISRLMAKLYADDAELYDIAFDWDVTDEVEWLLERLGAECRSVLDPGCGSGRMLDALARRGIEVTGIDLSPAMVELARRRLGDRGTVVVADMRNFDLGRTFDGAISPINTLLHLSPNELAAHLNATARHLRLGATSSSSGSSIPMSRRKRRAGRSSAATPVCASSGCRKRWISGERARYSVRGSR
jgi:SAM-dependent methyltransferase